MTFGPTMSTQRINRILCAGGPTVSPEPDTCAHGAAAYCRCQVAKQRTSSIQTCLTQDLVEPVAQRFGRALDENVVQRIWARDASL